jgi:hypothetical protein
MRHTIGSVLALLLFLPPLAAQAPELSKNDGRCC